MLILTVIVVFVVVSLVVFAIGSLLDRRSSRARLLRDRLASVQKAAERKPSEELALLRDASICLARNIYRRHLPIFLCLLPSHPEVQEI